MGLIPHRLSPETPYPDTVALLNDNFDKIVSDIGDLGGKFSTTASYSVTIAAGGMNTATVGVTDPRSLYVAGRLPITPRVEVFVDNNNDDNYLLGYSGSLSADQSNALVSVWIQRRASSGTVATFTIQIKNFGASPHTYYVVADESYTASPPTGNWR